jgi:hypothetical protein
MCTVPMALSVDECGEIVLFARRGMILFGLSQYAMRISVWRQLAAAADMHLGV